MQKSLPLSEKESQDQEACRPAAEDSKLEPIFMQNPDGSLVCLAPPGWKIPSPPSSPRLSTRDLMRPLFDNAVSLEDTESVYRRHELFFFLLLLFEGSVELAFHAVFVERADQAIKLVSQNFSHIPLPVLWWIFWGLATAELMYGGLYYILGIVCVQKNRPRIYKWFGTVALGGLLGQVVLAYMNACNVLVLLLRLSAYVYSGFLRNLLQGMTLLPAP
mmetsp:Transcript_37749/g.82911  ORF Transcript_37749/g.82911 Transcript_37749/m.82911 type:complete len:218 (+) Transcript_37749:137-790(+)|eukprot:CAMPEP_0170594856 /NCGR_PEP_ID=MMETSP0224-20130122/14228_1 /TAXON_ID=285029 /ORGANISM="Togula jolla, Strain CCCM 725" /LENGTH=217 /DNA_ID=CAMNT_0010918951 /DNA_START=138 /DNA_END=791 /DNA_ORIENTATION=-